ncbi:DNA polymerase III subunit delta [candidate division KSB3 bacterium]|uniref:DNA polymerase III subunit delta n=1 Tax=candidate division KSB3 bacterium TaxID=2044937 RepID=A0A2G6E279_9BACT|nr:MAG: DNA polymerase III subunit delta [candidate division KSB3 bacterium]PIE28661.1 MAG: DNA polymerase III subunit delta [candidate division KSB3 bacterium]
MAGGKEYINYAEFLRRFTGGEIRPLYLFQGQETFLIEECLDLVKQTLIPAESTECNYSKFAAGDTEIGAVMDHVQTMPFLSTRRLVVLTDIQNLKATDQRLLLSYCSSPNPSSCLVLTASKLDKRVKLAQVLKQQAEIVQFWKLFDRDLPPWIVRRATQYGRSMSIAAAQLLLECAGNDLRRLDSELKKIIAYAKGREISPKLVEQVVGNIREGDVFELVDALGNGDTMTALVVLNQLLTEGEQPLRILAMLTRQFRLLWKAKACLTEQRSLPPKQLAATLGLPPRAAEGIVRQARRFSQVKLKEALKQIYEVDRALKSSPHSPKILLEDVCIDLSS